MAAIFLLGSAQALLMVLLLLNKKGRTTADHILTAWLFFMGLHLLDYYLNVSGFTQNHPHLMGIGSGFPMLEGPFMFIYVSVVISKTGKFKLAYLLNIIPFLIYMVFLVFDFYTLSASEKIAYYEQVAVEAPLDLRIMSFPNIILGPIYVVWSLIKLRKHKRNISEDFSYTDEINLKWLSYVLTGLGAVFLVVIISNILVHLPFLTVDMHDYIIYIAFAISVFFLGFFGLKQQAIYNFIPEANINLDAQKKGKKAKESQYLHSGLKPQEAEKYKLQVLEYFEKERPYLNGKLSLREVADHLNISVNHLSQVINEQLGKTFFDFVSDYRVEEVKSRLAKSDLQNFTLLAIAYDSGFNSKSSFNTVFKRSTGKTPSQYAKSL
jgi:AraC-like DNA-binding protein